MSTRSEWIRVVPSAEMLREARQIRDERDRTGEIGYDREPDDDRSIGEVGAMVVEWWLKSRGCPESVWLRRERSRSPDFVIGTVRIATRTVGRVRMREEYGASLLPRHVTRSIDRIIFCCYEKKNNVAWILGTLPKDEFLLLARQYQTGVLVHVGLIPKEDTFEVPVSRLESPTGWLCAQLGRPVPVRAMQAEMFG